MVGTIVGAVAGWADAFEQLMRDRRSIRGFLNCNVPRETLHAIFATAQLAPSNCNVQPWVVHVVSGAAAEEIRLALHGNAQRQVASLPDFSLTTRYPDVYRTRQINAAKALFLATGIERDDLAARSQSFLRNFRFFDAPHAAFIFLPEWAGMREAADCGMYAQSLMLALTAHGVGSCAQGALSHYPELVRRHLGVSENLRLLFGLAFGYEDDEHPANATKTTRLSIDEAVIFHD